MVGSCHLEDVCEFLHSVTKLDEGGVEGLGKLFFYLLGECCPVTFLLPSLPTVCLGSSGGDTTFDFSDDRDVV